MISLLYKQRHTTREENISLSKCVCAYTLYIHIYIHTHTRVCPVTLASTLSVPGAAPRPPSRTSAARGINSAASSSGKTLL